MLRIAGMTIIRILVITDQSRPDQIVFTVLIIIPPKQAANGLNLHLNYYTNLLSKIQVQDRNPDAESAREVLCPVSIVT